MKLISKITNEKKDQALVGLLVGLLFGKSYHTRQKDGYSLPTTDPTNNCINWIWMSKRKSQVQKY